MKDKIDVLVIGAGPTGLMMAAEVARYGLSCRLIDKGASYGDKSRAVAIQARTMEVFGFLGLADVFLKEGLAVRTANPVSHFKRLAQISFDSLESPYPFVLSIEQTKTERILAAHVASFGVEIEKGIEFLHLEQNAEGVEVSLRHAVSGKEEDVGAAWVIGCDGAHSQVRKQLQLPFEGKGFADIFSLADVHVHWQYPHKEVFAFLNAKGILAAIPLPDPDRYRLVFQLLRYRNLLKKNGRLPYGQINESLTMAPTLKEIEELLCSYAGEQVRISNPVWIANFHINSRMASTYRKGRVFLAGDAAHIHSPVGGQGMNTGLQDAFNLAWKLAFVHKKQACLELLDTYNLERLRVGKRLLKATQLASYIATLHHPFAIALRNTAISFCSRISFFRMHLIRALSQTAIRYLKSLLTVEKGFFYKGPKAGLRAPNAPLLQSDLYALWRNTTRFQLLLFSGPQNTDLTSIAKGFVSMSVSPILISWAQESLPKLPGIISCNDPNGVAHHIYGADKTSCVYIIRPDLYIGYRSKKIDEIDLTKYFKNLAVCGFS